MEADREYSLRCTADALTQALSLRLSAALLARLIAAANAGDAISIEFGEGGTGVLTAGAEQLAFSTSLSQDAGKMVRKLYRVRGDTLVSCGTVAGKIDVSRGAQAVRERVAALPEAEERAQRKSKRLEGADKPAAPAERRVKRTRVATVDASVAVRVTKTDKAAARASAAASRSAVKESYLSVNNLPWLCVRRVPRAVQRGELSRLLEGLRVAALYVSEEEGVEERGESLAVFVEFETPLGASLGLLRHGERRGADAWELRPLIRSAAALAKGCALSLPEGRAGQSLGALFSALVDRLPPQLVRSPFALAASYAPLVGKLTPAMVGDGSAVVQCADRSPLFRYLRSPADQCLARGMGCDGKDSLTSGLVDALLALMERWSLAVLRLNAVEEELCSRQVSLFQALYTIRWTKLAAAAAKEGKKIVSRASRPSEQSEGATAG